MTATSNMPAKLADLLTRLRERGDVRQAGDEWCAPCPAHNDSCPSLYVRLGLDESCILLNCKAGCDVEDIVAALDLDIGDLFLDGDDDRVDGEVAITDGAAEFYQRPVSAPSPPVQEPADPDLCQRVYGDLLRLLPLTDDHRQELHRRGLDDDAINLGEYRTAERFALNQAVGRLKATHDDQTLLRVPGFRRVHGRVRFVDAEGLLVPVRNLTGAIVALKLRRPATGGDGPKYLYVSSAGDGGPSPGSPPHVPVGTPVRSSEIRFTEGELKADVAFAKSGLPTIGAAGVANWRSCLAVARAMEACSVRLAFDQDDPPRPGVIKELRACAEGLLRVGFAVMFETWDSEGGKFKGIDDLLATGRSPKAVTGPSMFEIIERLATAAGAAGRDDDDWLPADPSEQVEPFPMDVFPVPLQQFASEVAASMQCPVDFVAMAMLAIAGTAIGTSREIQVREGWEEGPQIYGAIVSPPGTAKTPALRAACAPVYAEQKRLRIKHQRDKVTYEEHLEAYESARKARGKSDEPAGPVVGKPAKPVMPHLFVGDATTEALGAMLDQNPRGLIKICDELTGWVLGLNQYRGGRGSDRQFYLSCWSGEPAKIDRKSDQGESQIITDPFLSVIGCIPPGKLYEIDAENNCDDGFVHRILFSYPKPVRNRRWTSIGLSAGTRQLWKAAVDSLYALEPGQDEGGSPVPVVLRFTPEATARWEAWYNAHFVEVESKDFPDTLVGPWCKMVAYAARLALVVHLLRNVCGEVGTEDVDVDSLVRALRLITYFQSHARVVYGNLHAPAAHDRARKVIDWIRRHDNECNPTHLAKNNVAGIAKTSDAEAIMKELEDLGYGRRERRKAGNNRDVWWFVAKRV